MDEFGRLLRIVSRHPSVADTMVLSLGGGPVPCFRAVRSCVHSLTEAGLDVSSRTSLAGSQEVLFAQEPEPHEPEAEWQHKATKRLHEKFQE